VEFAYNNVLSTTTGVSPFFTNKGYHPNITVYPECNIAFSWACNFAIDLNELQSTLKAEISVARQHYQKSTDARHSPAPDFKVGNKVFVKAQFFQTTHFLKKLSEKYLGLYEIIAQPSTLSFTLCFPESMHSVYPVFHVSMLEPATSNTFSKRIQLAPALVITDREPEYEISQIVDSKINCQWAWKLLYKMIWLEYEDTGDKSELTHAMDLISDFHIAYPTKPSSLPLSWSRCCSLSLHISNRDFFFINLLVYSVYSFSLTLSFCALFGVFFKTSNFFSF